MSSPNMEQKLQTLAQHFRPVKPTTTAVGSTARAAVLVCLFQSDDGHLRVILTKRASTLSSHSGEVSLPGGKREEGDSDDVITALREAKEEIGLEPSLVNVVTVLEPFMNKQGMPVIPVIGILNAKEAFTPAPNPAEVEAVFDAPMEMFIKDENRRVEMREWMGNEYMIQIFDYEMKNAKYKIWGLTASILIKAASIVYERPPPFVEQNPSYKVAFDVESEDNRMGSSNLEQRLQTLAQHFRLQKPIKPELSPTSTSGSIKRAAVLVCLFQEEEGGMHVILTKRASTLSSHSGEVALPGGKREQGDADDVHTALREAKEEIGLDPSQVNIVTVLEPFVNKLGMTVVPVIGLLSNKEAFKPAPSAAEVEAIFYAPLEMFLKDENRRAEEREWMGYKYLLHHFYFDDHGKQYDIWAITAGILIKTASLVYQRQPAFLEQRPKFWSGTAHNTTT
ncbi:nudix hydrolase 15, mitochondrial-like [Argentina anserina]|uniref:nudix hydrolase 15, mitochondrial-like n=1 Tax=Argentina anserina TaxID=57926 RepID=UPI002176827C|nr:nudix hydrolase 15, mitochondrial-like [Potentilla anserina]